MLFVNGIPAATLELKSEFKQSVENAKRQYLYVRPVKDPITRKPEPLLILKRGELVHFAVSARKPSERISYYAFTATPKAKTLELFGRPPDPSLPASEDYKPEPFHVYSMRQAIEEGFILDVLQNYAIYGTEVSDEDQLHFAQGIAYRVSRDEAVMEQVRNHNEGQVMHGLLPKKVIDAVLDNMGDDEKLSMPLLESEESGRKFVQLILRLLLAADTTKGGRIVSRE